LHRAVFQSPRNKSFRSILDPRDIRAVHISNFRPFDTAQVCIAQIGIRKRRAAEIRAA
jgi:hypothetical protein